MSMLSGSVFVLAFGVAACHPPAAPRLGLRYPPLPAGWTHSSGSLIPTWPESTQYVIQILRDSVGLHVWLAKGIGFDSTGQPQWELRDTMPYPVFGSDRRLVYADCSLRGRPDFEIIALVKEEDTDSLRGIIRAWRADTHAERIVPIPTAGVACNNEGYGI